MERRNFIKISALSGALATLESCGSPDHQLIRFIPDEDLDPGHCHLETEPLHDVRRRVRPDCSRHARRS